MENLPVSGNRMRIFLLGPMTWKVMQRNVWTDIANLRIKRVNSTIIQSRNTMHVCERNLLVRSQNGQKRVTSVQHVWFLRFITRVNSSNVVMWETQHNNEDLDYFKTLTLQVTYKTRNQHRAESDACKSHVRANKLDVQEAGFSFS